MSWEIKRAHPASSSARRRDVLSADAAALLSRHSVHDVPLPGSRRDYHQNGVVTGGGGGGDSPRVRLKTQSAQAVTLLEDLRLLLAVDSPEDNGRGVFNHLPHDMQEFLTQWVPANTTGSLKHNHSQANGLPSDSLEENIRKLESDKESLVLQVSVLTDQVEAQGEKIHDLETSMDKDGCHKSPKNMTRSELISRTTLETHKLDLMAEISNLKLKLATSEKERREAEERLAHSQKRIDELQARLNDRTIEVTELRARLAKNGTIHGSNTEPPDSEVEKLKKAVEALMQTNSEKDQYIEEQRKMLTKYQKIEELVLATQGRKGLEQLGIHDDCGSDSSSTHNSSSSNEVTVRADSYQIGEGGDYKMPTPSATSTPVNPHIDVLRQNGTNGVHHNAMDPMTPPSKIYNMHSPSPRKPTSGVVRSNSAENLTPLPAKTPPTSRHHGTGYAQTEDEDTLKDEMAQQYKLMQAQGRDPAGVPLTYEQKKKQKGLKRFFGKLRRSSSQDMDFEGLEDFKRSGLRATAGPRLGWSKDFKYNDIDVPFSRWDGDRVAAWLHSMGLSMYVTECKRWVKNGDQLLKASPHELEKELCLRNPLHRKKVQLALQAIGSDSHGRMDELDHNWVLRWLDDIGLPQYKDSFTEGRIDGRMLHYLTVEDLLSLKVTNALHHLSIKRSIQVLRRNNWNPGCLRRRPSPEDSQGPLHNLANEVMLWTNHRVMEWLRTIDLSEYAPNLRGSGVHGGLMVLEPRFGAEIFASLLSIPGNKTLLRRHLSTHFVALIGNEMQHKKREYEAQPGYSPLTPNQKLKLKKFGIFGHRRTRSDPDLDDYVCPMEGDSTSRSNGWRQPPTVDKQVGAKDEKAAKEIGAYSHEINTLTHMLAKDRFLDDVPTSDV